MEILAPLWPRVAGKHMAQHSRPVAFGAGTLTLATSCSSWAAQLRLMAEEIRAEINSFLGCPVVKKLRVQYVSRLDGPEPAMRPQQLVPLLETSRPDGVDSAAELDPEIARVLRLSFTKYFARNGRRVH